MKIKIKPGKHQFAFGNCAMIAIANAFDIPYSYISLVCTLLKIKNPDSGLTFDDCKKIINLLTKELRIFSNCTYVSNRKTKLTYLEIYNDDFRYGTYLIDAGHHLSCMINGVIIDSYLWSSDIKKIKPTGWWILS